MSIYKKLALVKSKIGKISKDSKNPFFKSKYFDVNSLLEHTEPLLAENQLLLLQPIIDNKVVTKIIDLETGESEYSEIKLPSFEDAQKIGSAITYYRRYTLQSLLGLQAEDDDANKASSLSEKKESPKNWLNVYANKTSKELTPEMTGVYTKMKSGEYKDISDIRKHFAVSKEVSATIEAWFVKLKKSK